MILGFLQNIFAQQKTTPAQGIFITFLALLENMNKCFKATYLFSSFPLLTANNEIYSLFPLERKMYNTQG